MVFVIVFPNAKAVIIEVIINVIVDVIIKVIINVITNVIFDVIDVIIALPIIDIITLTMFINRVRHMEIYVRAVFKELKYLIVIITIIIIVKYIMVIIMQVVIVINQIPRLVTLIFVSFMVKIMVLVIDSFKEKEFISYDPILS